MKRRKARRRVLLITLDTTRADRLGAYGYQAAKTPRLDRLASEGVVFERVLAAAPITLPAHVSLMTGSYPFTHGVRDNGAFSLSETVPTLASTLRGQGYRTAAFVSAFVLDRRFGLARGFLKIDPRFADAHGHRGGLLAARGRIDEAVRALRAAVDVLPDNVRYRVGLARILITARQLDETELEVRRTLQVEPDNADAHAAYGALWMARDQPAKALQEFERAVVLRPDADDIRLDLAGALDASGRRADARAEYSRLVAGRDTPGDIKKAAKDRLR